MVRVVSISERVRAFTGGRGAFEVEAANVRKLISELDRLYPGLGEHVDANMAIAVDGEITQDDHGVSLEGAEEVVLIPKISGG